MTSCSVCGNGYYASIQGQATSCVKCPGGYYCPSGKLIPCSKGYYSTGGKSSCTKCASGYYSNAGASSCSKCSEGYYSNSGASSCTKCSSKYPNCVKCDNNKCIECEDGYEPSEDGQKCEKKGCPDKTVEIEAGGKKFCVTQYNMGDWSGFPLSGVKISTVGNTCFGSNFDGKDCCWRGATATKCDSKNGTYSGCNRTVCTRPAGEIVCSNLNYDNRSWRLPTASELAYFDLYSLGKGSAGLMLCDYFSYDRLNSAGCYNNADNDCPVYGNSDIGCLANRVWSQGSSYELKNDSWRISSRGYLAAFSIRCVTELDE